jgi:hypothetical protein
MNALRFSFVLTIFLVLTPQFFLYTTLATSEQDEATLALTNAEQVVASTYQVVLETEQAGGDVSGLTAQLNNATEFLGEARVAFRAENFTRAISFANACYNISEKVRIEAYDLRINAYRLRSEYAWYMAIVSVLSVIGIGFSSFGLWRIFKSRYYRRVLEMKPEVVSNES